MKKKHGQSQVYQKLPRKYQHLPPLPRLSVHCSTRNCQSWVWIWKLQTAGHCQVCGSPWTKSIDQNGLQWRMWDHGPPAKPRFFWRPGYHGHVPEQMQLRARKTGEQLACLEWPMGHECTSKGHRGHTLLVTSIFICKGPMGHPVMFQMFGISCIDLVCKCFPMFILYSTWLHQILVVADLAIYDFVFSVFISCIQIWLHSMVLFYGSHCMCFQVMSWMHHAT